MRLSEVIAMVETMSPREFQILKLAVADRDQSLSARVTPTPRVTVVDDLKNTGVFKMSIEQGGGRPRKISDQQVKEAMANIAKGASVVGEARRLKTSALTLSKWIKRAKEAK